MEPGQESAYERLLAQGYSEEQIAAILGLAGLNQELGGLDKQRALAQTLRDAPTPQGRQAGRVYRAANPLEHLGGTMQFFGGERQLDRIDQREQDIINEQTKRRAEFLRRKLQTGTVPTSKPTGLQPPTGTYAV